MEECSRRGSNQRIRPKRARKPTISNRWFSRNFRPALTLCEWRIELPLPFNPPLDFADRDHADKELLGRDRPDPMNQIVVALPWKFTQLRKDNGVEQEHQKPGSRMRPSSRSKSSPPVGMARRSSAKLGALKCSS